MSHPTKGCECRTPVCDSQSHLRSRREGVGGCHKTTKQAEIAGRCCDCFSDSKSITSAAPPRRWRGARRRSDCMFYGPIAPGWARFWAKGASATMSFQATGRKRLATSWFRSLGCTPRAPASRCCWLSSHDKRSSRAKVSFSGSGCGARN